MPKSVGQTSDSGRDEMPLSPPLREIVASMTDVGMSTRAIGAALGVARDTVHRRSDCPREALALPHAADTPLGRTTSW
jgi:hypothetical protein